MTGQRQEGHTLARIPASLVSKPHLNRYLIHQRVTEASATAPPSFSCEAWVQVVLGTLVLMLKRTRTKFPVSTRMNCTRETTSSTVSYVENASPTSAIPLPGVSSLRLALSLAFFPRSSRRFTPGISRARYLGGEGDTLASLLRL